MNVTPFRFDLTFDSDRSKVFADRLDVTHGSRPGSMQGVYAEPGVFSAPIVGGRIAPDGTFSFELDAQQGAEIVRCRVEGRATLPAGVVDAALATRLEGTFYFVRDGVAQRVGDFVALPDRAPGLTS